MKICIRTFISLFNFPIYINNDITNSRPIHRRNGNYHAFYRYFLCKFKSSHYISPYHIRRIANCYVICSPPIDNQIISLFEKFQLKGYIVETTPFRQQKYQQITEKTPIKLFKEEFGFNES